MGCRGYSKLAAFPFGIKQVLPLRGNIFVGHRFLVVRRENYLVDEGYCPAVSMNDLGSTPALL